MLLTEEAQARLENVDVPEVQDLAQQEDGATVATS